jgi:hypothetical protein
LEAAAQKELEAAKQRELEATKHRELEAAKERELEISRAEALPAAKEAEIGAVNDSKLEGNENNDPEAEKARSAKSSRTSRESTSNQSPPELEQRTDQLPRLPSGEQEPADGSEPETRDREPAKPTPIPESDDLGSDSGDIPFDPTKFMFPFKTTGHLNRKLRGVQKPAVSRHEPRFGVRKLVMVPSDSTEILDVASVDSQSNESDSTVILDFLSDTDSTSVLMLSVSDLPSERFLPGRPIDDSDAEMSSYPSSNSNTDQCQD